MPEEREVYCNDEAGLADAEVWAYQGEDEDRIILIVHVCDTPLLHATLMG